MKAQFVFLGPHGSFPVKPGESRIGSDAACDICIRGEGVLPVHAYLRMDGEKLLIRPADVGTSSEGGLGPVVSVNGKSLAGPVILIGGEDVGVGQVQMRLGLKRTSLLRRGWFRWLLYSTAGIAAVLLIALLVVKFVLLEPGRIKEKVARLIHTHLLREESDITGGVQVDLFAGTLRIDGLVVKERYNFANSSFPFLDVRSLTLQMTPWQLLGCCTNLPRQWFGDMTDLKLVLNNPQMVIERSKTDGSFSIEDILASFRGGPTPLGMQKLSFEVEVTGGTVRLRDSYAENVGETSLEDINIKLTQAADGAPLAIEHCSMKTNSLKAAAPGMLAIGGRVQLIDDQCVLDFSRLSSEDLRIAMQQFDLARLFEHFGYAWEPYGVNFKVVPGKPITGEINLKLRDPRNFRAYGTVQSDSLLSLREKDAPPLGNIPMSLEYDIELVNGGRGYRPHGLNVKLRSGGKLDDPRTAYLVCDAVGRLNPGGASDYSLTLQHCNLEGLCGTDVGRALGLQGRLGGRLEGDARVRLDANGRLIMDARLETSRDSYVMVTDLANAPKPPTPPRPAVRQPLPLKFNCHASAEPGAAGGISHINIEGFGLSAPSVEAKSTVRGWIRGLGPAEKLEAHAQFKLNLKGREFWNEFAPILDLFGFKKPVQEMLNLTVTVVGKDDLVSVAAEGTAARQWGAGPAPVELLTVIDYNAKALQSRAAEPPPYLSLELRVNSAQGKPLNLRTKAQCRRTDKTETIVLEGFDPERNTPLLIDSDLVTLRERFQPYIEGYLSGLDEALDQKASWLGLYRDTVLGGELEQSGRLVLMRMLDRKSAEPDRVEFDLAISGKDLKLDMPLYWPVAPASVPVATGRDAGPTKERFVWDETAPVFRLKGSYQHRVSDNKEEPSKERLTVDRLEVKGRLGEFKLEMSDLDLFRLANLRGLPNQTWTDTVARVAMSGQVSPPACDFLRALHILAPEHPLSGTLAVQAAFDREKDTLDLQKFVFRQTDTKRDFFVLNLDVDGSLVHVRDLVGRLLPAAGEARPFSQNVVALMQAGGPAAFLDHLGEHLSINALQLETQPLVQWLIRDYKPVEGVPPPAIIAALLNKDWQPEGTWKAFGVRLTRNDPKLRKWSLVGALLRSDLTCFGPPAAPGAERPPAFTFSHDWRLMMGLAVSQDSSVAVEGDILLDDAFLAASAPQLEFDFRKPAKEPCKLEISDFSYSHGLLAQVGKLKFSSKPLTAEINNLEVRDFAPPHDRASFAVKELIIGGGPLPCALGVEKYEPAADSISFRIDAPNADVAYLARVLGLPKTIDAKGKLKDLSFAYKGSIVAAQAMVEPDAKRLLARFPKLQPGDARLTGLNPESDRLALSAQMDGVTLAVPLPLVGGTAFPVVDAGKLPVLLRLGGRVQLTTRDLMWKELVLDAGWRGGEADPPLLALTCPSLQVNSLDAKLNLLRALKAAGVPVDVHAQLAFSTPLDGAFIQSLPEAVLAALAVPSAPTAPNEKRLNALEKLCLGGSIRAPAVRLGDTLLTAFHAQDYSLKTLKLVVPSITAEAFGGKIALSDGSYDFTRARSVVDMSSPASEGAVRKAALRGVEHRQRLEISNIQLPLLLAGSTPDKNGFRIGGRLDARGDWSGLDFSDRLSWEGCLKLKVAGLSVEAPRAESGAKDKLPPWAAGFASLGDAFSQPVNKIAGNDTLIIKDLAQDLPVDGGQKALNGLLLALQVYLGKAFGVESGKLEFEPIAPTVTITKGGFASSEPIRLVGIQDSAGLELQLRNLKVSLPTETFADDSGEGAIIQPVAIPKTAKQKLVLENWPPGAEGEFLNALDKGRLPLRVYGRLAAPVVKMPWLELRSIGRRALFDTDKITDLETLDKARKHCLRVWGTNLDAAAAVGDRTGVGLPATVTARDQGEAVVAPFAGLEQSIVKLLSNITPTISPRESLDKLLVPEPDVPKPPGGKSERTPRTPQPE